MAKPCRPSVTLVRRPSSFGNLPEAYAFSGAVSPTMTRRVVFADAVFVIVFSCARRRLCPVHVEMPHGFEHVTQLV